VKARAEVIIEVGGREVYRGPSRSFVKNLGLIITGMWRNRGDGTSAIYATVVNLNGSPASAIVERKTYGPISPMAFNAPDNYDTYGVVVGSGTTPVSPDDYNLASKIPHGTGAGQLDYDTHTVASSYSSTSSFVEICRTFVNKSSSDVVVREVGLIARAHDDYAGVDVKYLIARDVLPSPVTVKPLGSLAVRYRISLSL
jgi:hypothetical protein